MTRFKVGDRVRIVASPIDVFNESLAEMAGDVGVVEFAGTALHPQGDPAYEVAFNDGLMHVEIGECDLQPEEAPFRERWDAALDTLSLIRTAITDPGAGYEIPAPEVAADALDYAIECIMLDVDSAALRAAGYEPREES